MKYKHLKVHSKWQNYKWCQGSHLSLHLDLSFDQKTDLNLKATSEVVLHPKIFYERLARSSRGNRSLNLYPMVSRRTDSNSTPLSLSLQL